MNYLPKIADYLKTEMEILQSLDQEAVNTLMNMMEEARLNGKRIFICGNGGSAATASHFVCDFGKGVTMKLGGKPFHFNCLSDNTPIITALGNDICYEDIFVFQIRDIIKPGDVMIAISGSGNSENVVRAVKYAKEKGAVIIGLTGFSGGKLMEMSDIRLHVPIDDMQIAEDIHMIFDHLMMKVI